MASKRFPIRGGFYALPDRHWSQQDVLNMLAMPSETGGTKTEWILQQAPGLRPFVQIGTGKVRGMRNVEGKLFVVSGTQLYEITPAGVAIPRGTIPGTSRVSMAHNQYGGGNQLIVVNGSAGYVYDTTAVTLTKITDEGYPGAFIAAYVDQYLAQVEPQGRYWFHSDLADATAYNTLDRYEAEGDPDRIVTLHVSHREVLLFGKDTIEPFVNTGAQTGTFERASNTVIECGCAAKYAVASMDNSVFWLDDKRIVRRLDGYTPVRISNAGIEQALRECSHEAITRAFAFTFEDGPHKVYYLTVPGHFTFGFDLLTGEWHRRGSPGLETWRLSDLVFWDGQWVGGDSSTGKLYTLDWEYCFDGTEELVREWSSGVLFADQRRIEVNEIEPLATPGNPTDTVGSFPAQPTGPTIAGDPPDAVVGQAYTYRFTATGGTPPYTFSHRSGTLPPGLAQEADGDLTGTFTTGGTYSAIVTRVTDATGLWDEITNEIVVAEPMWFYGPVAEDGALGGSEAFYLRTADPTDWSAAPIALPNGMVGLGRISVANAVVFFHPDSESENAQVSHDGGETFAEADSSLFTSGENSYGVYWNGDYYYFRHLRSADGLTWAAIPNLPEVAANIDSYFARDSDGLVLLAGADGNIHTSLDNGATWTTRVDPMGGASFYPFATNGTRIVGGASLGIGVGYSDDAFATAATWTPTGAIHGLLYANGAWIGQYTGQGLYRSTDGATYAEVVDVTGVGDVMPRVGYGNGVWGWAHRTAVGAPTTTAIYTSDDNGETWTLGDTLYGDGGNLVYGG